MYTIHPEKSSGKIPESDLLGAGFREYRKTLIFIASRL
jgi:hypothetical protein